MKHFLYALNLGLLSGVSFSALAQGKPLIIDQHCDVNAYYGSAWNVTLHDWDWGLYRDPAKTFVFLGKASRATWPTGSNWTFFSDPGASLWIIPQGPKVAVPYMGVATDQMPGTFFDSYFNSDPRINRQGRWIKYALVSVSGPGQFAMWQVDSFGTPTPWMTTKDGIGPSDCLYNLEGGHTHYNWGFTAKGKYEVTFEISALKNGVLKSSGPIKVTFGVETLPSRLGQ